MPKDTPCAILLADPRDRTLGNSFDTQYELTAHPFKVLWGPGTWADGAAWLNRQQPPGDKVTITDRLFRLRFDQQRLYMPRDPGVTAGLSGGERTGTWYLIRADYPLDAFRHQRHLLSNDPGHAATGFCRECPAESIASGTWQEMIERCAAERADITPRTIPDIRAPLCWQRRWNELTEHGQWTFPID